jgi:hypothetical protein
LPDPDGRLVPALAEQLGREADEDVRMNLVHLLGTLDLEGQRALFQRGWRQEQSFLPRCILLSFLARLDGEQTPAEALELLAGALDSIDHAAIQRYHQLPSVNDLRITLALPLAMAGDAYAERALSWLTRQVEDGFGVSTGCALGLLTLALRSGCPADGRTLAEPQRRAILAVARQAWPEPYRLPDGPVHHSEGHLEEALRIIGLPARPSELGDYLGVPIHGAIALYESTTDRAGEVSEPVISGPVLPRIRWSGTERPRPGPPTASPLRRFLDRLAAGLGLRSRRGP